MAISKDISKIILILIVVWCIMILLYNLLKQSNMFSIHAYLRNCAIVIFFWYYIKYKKPKMWILYFVLGFLVIEGIIEYLQLKTKYSIFDEKDSKTINYYLWHDLSLEQIRKYKNEPQRWSATEGNYHDENGNYDLTKSVEQAQIDQHNWILDQLNVKEGVRIIDLGCGYGNLLNEAKKRGAKCFGITLSQPQIDYIKENFDIDCMIANARDIPESLFGKFDVIVCNGSMEHFLPVEEVRKGNESKIYTKFFEQCSKLFDPNSPIKKQCITLLHKNPERIPKWNLYDWFNAFLIAETYGGYYPDAPDGLTKNAKQFKVIKQYDATLDYELSSREGIDGAEYDFGSRFKRNWSFDSIIKLGAMAVCDPYYIHKELYYGFNSWRWQFKNKNCIHYWIVLQLK